jgi:ATP-dependent exoDNAse (exonuclease V) beta subunit
VVFLGSLNYEFPKFYKKNPFSIEPETQREEIQNLLWEEEAKEELRVIYTALTRSSRYSYVSSSLKFYKPTWLYNYKEHPQFKFLKANAKYCGLVPKSYEHTRSIYERSELRGEEEAEEELIQMMERHSIN